MEVSPRVGSLSAIAFAACVGYGLAADRSHAACPFEAVLPGFAWLTVWGFVLGLAEIALYGAFAGLLYTTLYNHFARRVDRGTSRATATRAG